MKRKFTWIFLPAMGGLCLAQEASAQKNELAFGLGGITALSRADTPGLDAGSGVALQVNYGRRFLNSDKAALYGEINFLASPLREVSTSVTTATRDFASLYVTPGIRVKFLPASRISPYAVVGGGYADYGASAALFYGRPHPVDRQLAPADFALRPSAEVQGARLFALRWEARDFF